MTFYCSDISFLILPIKKLIVQLLEFQNIENSRDNYNILDISMRFHILQAF